MDPATGTPMDTTRPPVDTEGAVTISIHLRPWQLARLRALAKGQGFKALADAARWAIDNA